MKLIGRLQPTVDLVGGMQCIAVAKTLEPICIAAKPYMDETALKLKSDGLLAQQSAIQQ